MTEAWGPTIWSQLNLKEEVSYFSGGGRSLTTLLISRFELTPFDSVIRPLPLDPQQVTIQICANLRGVTYAGRLERWHEMTNGWRGDLGQVMDMVLNVTVYFIATKRDPHNGLYTLNIKQETVVNGGLFCSCTQQVELTLLTLLRWRKSKN